jgi:hypothetical protein
MKNMKKVNLKGKLGLKKETISKLDMGNVSGGQTGQGICAQTQIIICQIQTLKPTCNTITHKPSICFTCTITTTGQGGSLGC